LRECYFAPDGIACVFFSFILSVAWLREGLGARHTGKCDALRPYRCHEGLRNCNRVRLHKCLFYCRWDCLRFLLHLPLSIACGGGLGTRHTGRCDARRPYMCREGTRDLPENGLHRDDGFAYRIPPGRCLRGTVMRSSFATWTLRIISGASGRLAVLSGTWSPVSRPLVSVVSMCGQCSSSL
jgi:hypothetical protein